MALHQPARGTDSYQPLIRFLDHNVKLVADLPEEGINFRIIRHDPITRADAVPQSGYREVDKNRLSEGEIKPQWTGDAVHQQFNATTWPSPAKSEELPEHSIPEDEYIHIRDHVVCGFSPDSEGKMDPTQPSILLQVESPAIEYAQALVECLAKDLKADLVSLNLHDLEDLGFAFHPQNSEFETAEAKRNGVAGKEGTSFQTATEHPEAAGNASGSPIPNIDNIFNSFFDALKRASPGEQQDTVDYDEDFCMAKFYFGTPKSSNGPHGEQRQKRNRRALNTIFNAAASKAERVANCTPGKSIVHSQTPLIVFVHDTIRILKLKKGHRVLARLRNAIAEHRQAGIPVFGIFLCTTRDPDSCGDRAWRSLGLKKTGGAECFKLPIPPIGPEELRRREAILNSDANVRELNRGLKRRFSHLLGEEVVGAEAGWGWKGLHRVDSFLGCREMGKSELNSIVKSIGARAWEKSKIELKDIISVLDGTESRRKRQKVENEACQSMDNLNEVEKSLSKYVMKPGQSPIMFNDVIMDPITKDTIRQLIALSKLKAGAQLNPLFEQFKMPGILFFGPPGTGKTHLCRAIANDTGQTFLSLSAAELNSCLVGETEKLIRGMFSLARKLHPCILFLDEADSLFYKRTSTDKAWQRSALAQYLQEMDGLASNNTDSSTPLVIVATNRPADLDEAFLRRLPHKVYFKLPTQRERKDILRMLLSKDNLKDEIDLNELARRTKGFSGSDLKTLCSQAVLSWATEQEVGNGDLLEGEGIRLTMDHFDLAFGRTGATTSPELLEQLMQFRKRFQG
ncbi:Spastin [Dactylella cylindrospora]|nr:Spastin [Dactylella cylindrospora]